MTGCEPQGMHAGCTEAVSHNESDMTATHGMHAGGDGAVSHKLPFAITVRTWGTWSTSMDDDSGLRTLRRTYTTVPPCFPLQIKRRTGVIIIIIIIIISIFIISIVILPPFVVVTITTR